MTKGAEALGVNHGNVSRASEYHDRPFVEFLRQLGFPRTNRAESHQFLRSWLFSDANCSVPSGENKRCYTGTPEMMWAEYATASLSNSIAPLQHETFHDIRRQERVGIRQGDIFINRDEVELAELTRESETDPMLREKYASRMAELERNLRFCKERKKFYRDCHQQLQGNPKKMIITADFTAAQTGMQDKFSNFVVVVCTDGPLYVPLDLVNEVAEPEKPPSMRREVEKPVLENKSRRKKKEIAESGEPGRQLLSSWAQEKAKMKMKVAVERDGSIVYKPNSTVFHFVIRRSEDTPGQISPYVQWALNYLLVKHDLANCYDEVQVFSDGCGKHFKTYPTHWYVLRVSFLTPRYIADLQEHLRDNNTTATARNADPKPKLVWDFLPPGDAHNRCDAAAANWKRPQKKLARDFCVLTTVGHLAFACAELRNCYMIEADYTDFPDPLECVIEAPWMREAFHFEYGKPYDGKRYCKHITNERCELGGCNHACCAREPLIQPCVDITIRDRDDKYFFFFFLLTLRSSTHTLWLDATAPKKNSNDMESLEEDEFWNSNSRRTYHAISGARAARLNKDDEEIYDYDDRISEHDCESYSGDDYLGI